MISLDTNLLLFAVNRDCAEHSRASKFLAACALRSDVVIAELVLAELYLLLRNPAVLSQPLPAPEAAEICQGFRSNRSWALVENAPVMAQVWVLAAQEGFPRRRLFDARIALTLRHHGVEEFATHNVRDFEGLGFKRVWDPLAE